MPLRCEAVRVMGRVEAAVRAALRDGQRLATPTGRGTFTVERLGPESLVLLLGAQEAWTPLRWECLEGIPDYLRGRGWVRIGSVFGEGADGTLDAYLKRCIARATAGWIAVVLEAAEVLELDRGRPAQVRLAAG